MKDNTQSCSEQEQIRAVPWLLASNVLSNFFCIWTFGGSIFLLFLNELGLAKGQIGMLLSLFPFCGLLALGFAPMAAHLGRKRVFILCSGLRNFVMALLLLLPLIITAAGSRVALFFLFAVIIVFALLRAISETASCPWAQEYVPNRLRGRLGGIGTVLSTIGACIAIWLAGQAIGHWTGLTPFMVLIAAGCVLGFLSVVFMVKVPGGEPCIESETTNAHRANMIKALKDKNFVAFLAGSGCMIFGSIIFASFLPLYIKDHMGVPSATIVMLDSVALPGAALSGILSGWMADRFGSRPVLMPAMALFVLIPLGWLLLPQQTPHAVAWCAALYILSGVASSGIGIGSSRLLSNGVIPLQRNTAYWAIQYAWSGAIGGLAVLLTGAMLTVCGGWKTRVGAMTLDGFSLLFLLALALLAAGWCFFGRVRPDDQYTTRIVAKQLMKSVVPHRLIYSFSFK